MCILYTNSLFLDFLEYIRNTYISVLDPVARERRGGDQPPEGVYAGVGILEGKEYNAGIVIGPGDRIEAHLIGYDGDAYDKAVTLKLDRFIREFKKFDTEAELIIQIKEDLKLC